MKLRLGLVGAVLIVVLSLLGNTSSAASSGLTISPLRAYPTQDPGVTTTSSINISNQSSSSANVSLSVETFKTIDENYDYSFAPAGASSYVTFSDSSLSLAAGQTKSEAYQVAVPADAKPGGYYYALVATTQESPSNNNFTVLKRVESLVYLQVNGNITHKLSLLGIDMPWLTTTPNLNVSARVANDGTSHDEAVITMPMRYWPFGKSRPNQALQGLILPTTIRRLSGQIRLGLMPGFYKVSADFEPPQGGMVQKTYTVLYFPFWLLAVLVFGTLYIIQRQASKSK